MSDYLKIARQVMRDRERPPRQLARESERQRPEVSRTPLETVLNGRAVELWSTVAGTFFLVADEDDARQAFELFGAARGYVYTAAEARRIIAVNEPTVVAEIHEWKREFNARVSDDPPGKGHRND